MQNLIRLVDELKKKSRNEQAIFNCIREYLQVLILKAIYQSKYGSGLSFMGGTALRICYDLKRYSEDLDFALDKKPRHYSFAELNALCAAFLKNSGFEVVVKVSSEKTVQKSFIKIAKVLQVFGLSSLESQNLQVKLEVDTKPAKVGDREIEAFFVTKFNELFPILKHTDATLFAGKICAVLNRAYTKGRDFYDLLWYLNRKQSINLKHLNRTLKQVGLGMQFKNSGEVIGALRKKVSTVDTAIIMKDISRFLEDPSEAVVMKKYRQAFGQAVSKWEHSQGS